MGLAVFAWHRVFPAELVSIFRPDAALAPLAAEYVRIRAWSLPALCFANAGYGAPTSRRPLDLDNIEAGITSVSVPKQVLSPF